MKVKDVHDYDYQYCDTGYDYYCWTHYEYTDVWDWMLVETDYHDHSKCDWNGIGVTREEGHECVWDMSTIGPTAESGVQISFFTDDYGSTPSPVLCSDTVDDGSVTRYVSLGAYEAVAHLNCTSSNSGDPTTGPIFESSGNIGSFTLSLAEPQVSAKAAAGLDPALASLNAHAAASWRLTTNPAIATLSSIGQLKVDIDALANGYLKAACYDGDDDDAGTISVGFSVGPVITFIYTVPPDDDEAALAGLAFAFDSELLGSDTNDKIELVS